MSLVQGLWMWIKPNDRSKNDMDALPGRVVVPSSTDVLYTSNMSPTVNVYLKSAAPLFSPFARSSLNHHPAVIVVANYE